MCNRPNCGYYGKNPVMCQFSLDKGHRRPCSADDNCFCYDPSPETKEKVSYHISVMVYNSMREEIEVSEMLSFLHDRDFRFQCCASRKYHLKEVRA